MNATLGASGVILSLVACLTAVPMLVIGLRRDRPELLQLAYRYALLLLAGMVVATIAMQRALITRDFEVLFVADHGSSRTAPLFNVATMWSALEGSILLWGLILAGYVVIVARKFRSRMTDPLVAWAMLTLFVVAGFFMLLMLGPANPFATFDPPPGYDGPGPNPLLQNHVLVAFHPPMLYLGYVGFTVPFAFAIAALVTGRLGEGWLLETRRWTLFAWGFLTAGIVLGAWWAYDVLGWGGYWGWDPVENASLLPWLTGTAYLHSVLVQERRGMLRVWNLSLVCATFSLTILGTFITRSGVLASVHAFSEGGVGPWLLAFFALTVVVTVGLIFWRGDRLRSPGTIDSPLSREGAFLANNLVFAAFAFIILLGTVFPLIVEALQNRRISVGVPYFERMSMPIGLTLLFLMAVAPVLPWRKTTGEVLARRLEWPAWGGVGALVFAVLVGARGLAPLLGFLLSGFAASSALRQLLLATRRQGWRGLVGRANGGMIVHLGVIAVGLGLIASSAYLRQGEFEMQPGETVTLGDTRITYESARTVTYPNRISEEVTLEVDGTTLTPSLERYIATGQIVPSPATRSTPAADVQVALLVAPEDGAPGIVVRATRQPMVGWLWFGGLVMLAGTVLSAFPGPLVPSSHLSRVGTHRGRRPMSSPADLDPTGPDDGLEGADDLPGASGNTVRIAAGVVAVVIGVFVVLLATRDTAQNGPNFDVVDQPSPAVVGTSFDGTEFDLDEILVANRSLPPEDQTWVVVNFFASWCAPCEAEHPDLIRFDTEGIVRPDDTACSTELVGVTFNDTTANVADFFERRGGDWPVLVGATSDMVVDFGVTSAPETVIVAPSGVVWQKITGQTSYDQLRELIPC